MDRSGMDEDLSTTPTDSESVRSGSRTYHLIQRYSRSGVSSQSLVDSRSKVSFASWSRLFLNIQLNEEAHEKGGTKSNDRRSVQGKCSGFVG